MAPIVLAFLAFALLAATIGILSWKQEQKRIRALADFAAIHGLSFSPSRDRGLSSRFSFIPDIRSGGNRYAQNILGGGMDGEDVLAFEHHYETRSSDSKGHTTTHHHYHSVHALVLPSALSTLHIAPEDIFSKIAQAFGYDDIDFESHAFSRAFCVRSKDRKFAYDFCNTSMMEHLLARPSTRLAVEGELLAVVYEGRHVPEALASRFANLLRIRSLIPAYLFSR